MIIVMVAESQVISNVQNAVAAECARLVEEVARGIVLIAVEKDLLLAVLVQAVEIVGNAAVQERSLVEDAKERAFTNNTLNTQRTIASGSSVILAQHPI